MIFLTGGAYQGKKNYALSELGLSPEMIIDGKFCDTDEIFKCRCVNNFQYLVRRIMLSGKDPCEFAARICEKNKDIIIIMDEIGSGIVPVDKDERKWREAAGKCGCIIARKSETVIRFVCGIPSAIKGNII